ncbi:hypothetical protein [Tabrizicola aquatica]|uniref:hypothetical protein n=1 Tax=Tabrizicola aquatica TaxID=909926 RepID=UPI000CD20475|nr:hypothetical protein [Tabrizicola aquatica]
MRTALCLSLLSTPALAQDWPPEVAEIVAEAQRMCRGTFTAEPRAVTRRDLNGDGTLDWVVDSGEFQCSVSSDTYCQAAGCYVDTVIDGTRGLLLVRAWDTQTVDGTTYLTAPNWVGETDRFLWNGIEWRLQ